jgi:hypothetical protein
MGEVGDGGIQQTSHVLEHPWPTGQRQGQGRQASQDAESLSIPVSLSEILIL